MDIRYSANPRDFKRYTTEEIRKEFLIEDLYRPDQVTAVYRKFYPKPWDRHAQPWNAYPQLWDTYPQAWFSLLYRICPQLP